MYFWDLKLVFEDIVNTNQESDSEVHSNIMEMPIQFLVVYTDKDARLNV